MYSIDMRKRAYKIYLLTQEEFIVWQIMQVSSLIPGLEYGWLNIVFTPLPSSRMPKTAISHIDACERVAVTTNKT